ncbi:MAG TPA: hypothetical protein VEX62_04090 [Candidatus Limnocylindrales bacterium]|nr:hypothetical protein [Candidatus Limnocylindrales bacterium]
MEMHRGEPRLGRYMVELQPTRNGYEDIRALTDRSRAACEELTREDVVVRLIRSVFVPDDGTWLLLLDASSAPAVAELGRLAALPVSRVSVLLATPEAEPAIQ